MNGKQKLILYLVSIIVTIILVSGGFLTKTVIANNEASRNRDEKIELRTNKKVDENHKEVMKEVKEINEKQTDILIAIAELKKDVNN